MENLRNGLQSEKIRQEDILDRIQDVMLEEEEDWN